MKAFRYEEHWTCSGDEDSIFPPKCEIICHEFDIQKTTKCGFFIRMWSNPKRFVKTSGNKRYAHLSKEEAIDGMICRKKRQIKILSSQKDRAEQGLILAEKLRTTFNAAH